MATLRLTVFALAIMLASAGKMPGAAASVKELRELLVSSMQTTISLTALVEQQTQKISDTTNFVDAAKEEIEGLNNKVKSLTASGEKLEKEIQALKESISEKREKDVLIVSGEEKLREPSCARVCAGTTQRGSTNWVDFSSNGIYTDVDISKCGFVTVPTVTTSLEGSTKHWTTTGSSEIYNVTTSKFRIYLMAEHGRGGNANKYHYNMEWIAVGYIC